MADFTNTTTGLVLSGDSRREVTATGLNLNFLSTAPTLADLTTQIGLANAGTNPSGGWKPITASTLTNSQGSNFYGTISGIAGAARWMWWNSGNDPSATAPFSPGFNHSEYLIFRLPINTTGTPPPPPPGPAADIPTLPEWAAIIMAALLMGVAVRAQARNRV